MFLIDEIQLNFMHRTEVQSYALQKKANKLRKRLEEEYNYIFTLCPVLTNQALISINNINLNRKSDMEKLKKEERKIDLYIFLSYIQKTINKEK